MRKSNKYVIIPFEEYTSLLKMKKKNQTFNAPYDDIFSKKILSILDRKDFTAFEKSSAIMKYLSEILEKQLIKQNTQTDNILNKDEPEIKKVRLTESNGFTDTKQDKQDKDMNDDSAEKILKPNQDDRKLRTGEKKLQNITLNSQDDDSMTEEASEAEDNKNANSKEIIQKDISDNNKNDVVDNKPALKQLNENKSLSNRPKREKRNIRDIRRDWIYYN